MKKILMLPLLEVANGYQGPQTTAYPYYGTTQVDWANWGVTYGAAGDYGADWWNSEEYDGGKASTQYNAVPSPTDAAYWQPKANKRVEKVTSFDMLQATTPSPAKHQVDNCLESTVEMLYESLQIT